MNKDKQDWDAVWSKNKNLLNSLVNLGRKYYNGFFMRAIRPHINQNTRFAELGCGTSTLIRLISPKVICAIGMDISQEALALSRKNCINLKNVFFIKDDCTKLKTKSNQFDLVWSQGLIEHFKNPEVLINEHIKICKPGKTVLISVPYLYSYMYLWYLLTRLKILRFLWPWTDQEFYTSKKFIQLMKKLNYPARNYSIYKKNAFLGIIILKIVKKHYI